MLRHKRKKIPCYVVVFDQVDIIKKSLNFLAKYADRLDLIVMENPSSNTPEIERFINGLGDKKLVKRYYLFNENITNNVFNIVMNKELDIIKKSCFIILTDGDLDSKNEDWLQEEVDILNHHKDVFACGVSLDMSNLPIATFPDAAGWIPTDINTYSDFYEAKTGAHLLLLRGAEYSEFMKWKNENNVQLVDGEMHKYCYEQLNKKWARTKNSKAYHFTWDLYHDKNHPYTQLRLNKSLAETWYHKKESDYTLKEY